MGKRILIVDDDAVMASSLADYIALLYQDHDVQIAGWGPEALAKMHRQPFDLVITDYRMPEMDGLALMERIRATHPGTDTILMTGDGLPELEETVFHLGGRGKLDKPFSSEELLEVVEAVLG